ncbi:MAG: lasso peptide biosynthesis B2 protein [Myxococcales bacterium]|nr:lasso peptide biosynthesis B2 protein [Myxococcales bacterium]
MTDEAIHALARVLLRLCSPLRAHSLLVRAGALLPRRRGHVEILRAASRLRSRGTCLSRALALAARTPEADVVIGVMPQIARPIFAHAWLELHGEAIDPSDVAGSEIARLGPGRPPRA